MTPVCVLVLSEQYCDTKDTCDNSDHSNCDISHLNSVTDTKQKLLLGFIKPPVVQRKHLLRKKPAPKGANQTFR